MIRFALAAFLTTTLTGCNGKNPSARDPHQEQTLPTTTGSANADPQPSKASYKRSAEPDTGFGATETHYIQITSALMQELGFPIRDTITDGRNLDDFYVNQGYEGPRRYKIDIGDYSGNAASTARKRYDVGGATSIAYDQYATKVPKRYLDIGREDPIVHECAHFLQEMTAADESAYITGSAANYAEYVSQRSELEAHLVQILYITRSEANWLAVHTDAAQREDLVRKLEEFKRTHDRALGIKIILTANTLGVI